MLDTAPRFFDKNNDEISNVVNKEPLVDIKFTSSGNMDQMKRRMGIKSNKMQMPRVSTIATTTMTNILPQSNFNQTPPSKPVTHVPAPVQSYTPQFPSTPIQEERRSFSFHCLEKSRELELKVVLGKNSLPMALIILGFLLLIIQLIK